VVKVAVVVKFVAVVSRDPGSLTVGASDPLVNPYVTVVAACADCNTSQSAVVANGWKNRYGTDMLERRGKEFIADEVVGLSAGRIVGGRCFPVSSFKNCMRGSGGTMWISRKW
jgi:hypothetical protein